MSYALVMTASEVDLTIDHPGHPDGACVPPVEPMRLHNFTYGYAVLPAAPPSQPFTPYHGSTTTGSRTASSANSPLHALSINSSANQSMSTLAESIDDQPIPWQTNPPELSLPQPAIDHPNQVPSLAHAVAQAVGKDKGRERTKDKRKDDEEKEGLIRRMSRGATNRIRRRPSATQTNRFRDQSAGPVIMRRRSDSAGATDMPGDLSDLDFETNPEEPTQEPGPVPVSPDSEMVMLPGTNGVRSGPGDAFEGGIALTISRVLEQGTYLLKVTKKKQKRLKFRLDTLAAKVIWNDKNPAKQFYIDDVREIRVGADARTSRQDIPVSLDRENCWMTIVYDSPQGSKGRFIKTMHLIAENDYVVKLWTDALKTVERERIEIMNALSPNVEKSQRSMQMAWKAAMSRKRPEADRKIDFEDARWICRKLEINCSNDTIRSNFNQADLDLMGMLTYAQYETFINMFKIRQDIKTIFDSLKPADEPELSWSRFRTFLEEHQGADVEENTRHWESKFDWYARGHSTRGFETPPSFAAPLTMNLQSFQNFLASNSNAVLKSSNAGLVLDRPFNEYFISSSHNTYLLGRQVAGASSVEGYISALVKGCRCIEVDCWDGKDGRPVVNHGRTLSTEVLFEDCISVIAKYAFASSPYPLIVSLEVHCSPDQQATMVEIMLRHFGEALLTAPLTSNVTSLPSPEELRHRILIKVKAAQQTSDAHALAEALNGAARRSRSFSSPFTRSASFEHSSNTWPLSPTIPHSTPDTPLPRFASSTDAPEKALSAVPSSARISSSAAIVSSSGSESEIATPNADSKKKRKTSNIIPALGALGVYACGIKYSDFGAPEARTYNHIYSFAENTFNNVGKDPENKRQLEKHNAKYLMRVYPAARRIDSSNFNPLAVWRKGVQMAALNWQTYDINMQVNEAMFAAGTDKLGYVLKPEEFHPPNNVQRKTAFVKFGVEIISAQRLPRPQNRDGELGMNPYIEFEMFSAEDRGRTTARAEGGTDISPRDGVSGIGTPVRRRTRVVEGNGFNPTWKENIGMTVETKYPNLIFVRWTVWNSPNSRNNSGSATMLASFTAKLSSLRNGYRHLPLFNAYGERYRDAKLFVKIKAEPYIVLTNLMHINEQDGEDAEGSDGKGAGPNGQVSEAPSRAESWKSTDKGSGDRSWPRKLFSRTPSQRKKSREASPREGPTRTSSYELS